MIVDSCVSLPGKKSATTLHISGTPGCLATIFPWIFENSFRSDFISASCEACSQPWLGRHRVEVIGVALDALENVLKSGVALNQPENPCARGSPRAGSETAV